MAEQSSQASPPPQDFSGRRAFVTGAGSGIGRAIAIRLAAGGASVAVVDLNADAATFVAEEIGERACALHADVSDESAVADVIGEAARRLGGLD